MRIHDVDWATIEPFIQSKSLEDRGISYLEAAIKSKMSFVEIAKKFKVSTGTVSQGIKRSLAEIAIIMLLEKQPGVQLTSIDSRNRLWFQRFYIGGETVKQIADSEGFSEGHIRISIESAAYSDDGRLGERFREIFETRGNGFVRVMAICKAEGLMPASL